MQGTVLVVIGLVALVAGAPALIVLPVVLTLIVAAMAGPLLMGVLRAGASGRGTPSSTEASYDPVDKGDRAVQ